MSILVYMFIRNEVFRSEAFRNEAFRNEVFRFIHIAKLLYFEG